MNATETKHTPTPWEVNGSGIVTDSNPDKFIGLCYDKGDGIDIDTETAYANAEFIVRACNSHAALVAALEDLLLESDMLPTNIKSPDCVIECRHCGRQYDLEDAPDSALECSEDCAGYKARNALRIARGAGVGK